MATPETFLTLGQAATATGKSKGTLSKAISTGKLSVAEKNGNQFKIDPAELFRVFPAKRETFKIVSNEQLETPKETMETRVLEVKLEAKDKEIALLASERDDLRRRLDTESEERRKLTMMLADMRQKPTEKPIEQRKGFFGRLLRKNPEHV